MRAYHRPTTLDEALSLLEADDRIVLAGGTVVNRGQSDRSIEVVDIQALKLGGVAAVGQSVTLGATTRLQDLVDSDLVPVVIRDLARAEVASSLRTMATVGGTIATNASDSGLVAGLLAHDAQVTIVSLDGSSVVPLKTLARAARQGALITSVEIAAGGVAATARTGRTPADNPIVLVVGRQAPEGTVHLAVAGAAAAPLLVDAADPAAGLDPPGDFRGTAEYRIRLVEVLAARVLSEIG